MLLFHRESASARKRGDKVSEGGRERARKREGESKRAPERARTRQSGRARERERVGERERESESVRKSESARKRESEREGEKTWRNQRSRDPTQMIYGHEQTHCRRHRGGQRSARTWRSTSQRQHIGAARNTPRSAFLPLAPPPPLCAHAGGHVCVAS